MRPKHLLPLLVSVNLGVMAIKGYYTFPRPPELGSHHQMQFSVILKTLTFRRWSYPSAENTARVFLAPPTRWIYLKENQKTGFLIIRLFDKK